MNGPNETVAHIGYHRAVAGRSDPHFSDDATALIHPTATPPSGSTAPAVSVHHQIRSALLDTVPHAAREGLTRTELAGGSIFTNDSPRTAHQRPRTAGAPTPDGLLTTGPAAMSPPIPTTASRNSQRRHHRRPLTDLRAAHRREQPLLGPEFES
jgi:hypothetical protein